MLPYRTNRLVAILIAIFFLAILGYAYFEARSILFGPSITIRAPESPLSVSAPLLHIRGSAEHIILLRMNGTPVSVTGAGDFDEALLLAPGYNKIVLSASDKLGRTTEKVLEVIYTGPVTAEDGDKESPATSTSSTRE